MLQHEGAAVALCLFDQKMNVFAGKEGNNNNKETKAVWRFVRVAPQGGAGGEAPLVEALAAAAERPARWRTARRHVEWRMRWLELRCRELTEQAGRQQGALTRLRALSTHTTAAKAAAAGQVRRRYLSIYVHDRLCPSGTPDSLKLQTRCKEGSGARRRLRVCSGARRPLVASLRCVHR
jgi:hypothetical protein